MIGNAELGYISVAEEVKNIPFSIKRVYWTYYTPQNVIRGGHAHRELEQLIVSVSGKIVFNVEDIESNKFNFVLDQPNLGLYLPPLTWRDIQFSHNAVLLCLSSDVFTEADYIRTYDEFKKIK